MKLLKERLDPCSETGMTIFKGNQEVFLRKHCHFAEGSDRKVMEARVALFSKIYRIVWLRVLESKDWESVVSFLKFMNFFMDYLTSDKELMRIIDTEKYFVSAKKHEDIFYDFFALKDIGDHQVMEYVMNEYFEPKTPIVERLLVMA